MPPKSYVIALEEHYQDGELKQHRGGGVAERLDDVGALRLKEMDEAGIDLQVLSHANPGLQGVDAATGVPLARRINDRLREAVERHPGRFAAFAAVPTADPTAAAEELERTVTGLGFFEPQGPDVVETLGDSAAPMLLQLAILVMFFQRDDIGFGRHYCPSLGDGFPE